MGVEYVALDLDGTLYPSTHGLERRIVPAVQAKAAELLGQTVGAALPTLHRWSRDYGHVALGVEAELSFDSTAFIDDVYREIDIDDIRADSELASAIGHVATWARVVILTNSPRSHAARVMERLTVPPEAITEVFAIEDFGFRLKPDPRPFKEMIFKTRVPPKSWIYFDDSIRNIHAAWKLGFGCCLVSNKVAPKPLFWENHFQVMHFAPEHIPHTFDLPKTLRSLSQ